MSQTFDIPVTGPVFSLALPDRCVNCGKPRAAYANFKFTRPARAAKNLPAEIALKVPQCAACRARSERTDYLMWISFFLGGLAAAGLFWLAYSLLWDRLSTFLLGSGGAMPETEMAATTVIVLAALISGVPGGFVLEAAARLLFLPCFPFFGVSLFYAPLLAIQLLGDVEYTAGLRGKVSRDFTSLRLKFYNEEVARDFEQMRAGS